MQQQLLQLASVVVVLMCTTGTSAKIVNTTYGKVEGNTITLDDGTTVNSWYGIPYAKPPVGDLRFEVLFIGFNEFNVRQHILTV